MNAHRQLKIILVRMEQSFTINTLETTWEIYRTNNGCYSQKKNFADESIRRFPFNAIAHPWKLRNGVNTNPALAVHTFL